MKTLGKIYNIWNHLIAIQELINESCLYQVKSLSERKQETHKLVFSQYPKEQSTHLEQVSIKSVVPSQTSWKSCQFFLSSLSHLPHSSLSHLLLFSMQIDSVLQHSTRNVLGKSADDLFCLIQWVLFQFHHPFFFNSINISWLTIICQPLPG